MTWTRHQENVQAGRCSNCNIVALLHWHFGEKQERKLCAPCGEAAWNKLLYDTGRFADWAKLVQR